jgi:hypothetical protein
VLFQCLQREEKIADLERVVASGVSTTSSKKEKKKGKISNQGLFSPCSFFLSFFFPLQSPNAGRAKMELHQLKSLNPAEDTKKEHNAILEKLAAKRALKNPEEVPYSFFFFFPFLFQLLNFFVLFLLFFRRLPVRLPKSRRATRRQSARSSSMSSVRARRAKTASRSVPSSGLDRRISFRLYHYVFL